MCARYYFGTYKKPVYSFLDKGEVTRALSFIREHREYDDLCDRHQIELLILEANCNLFANDFDQANYNLRIAGERIIECSLKGSIVWFYYQTKAVEMILTNHLQAAVKLLQTADNHAETDCQHGIIEYYYAIINFREGFKKPAHDHACLAGKSLKDDNGILMMNCQHLRRITRKRMRLTSMLFPELDPNYTDSKIFDWLVHC